jgi:iron-sulfur cluster assembly accessory protein
MVTQFGMVTFRFGLGELCRPSSPQDITNRVVKAKQKHLVAAQHLPHTKSAMSTTMNVSRRCLRALPQPQTVHRAWAPALASRSFSTTNTQSQQPLHLDFLAPSWQPTRSPSSSLRSLRRDVTSHNQRRALSATPQRRAKAITNPRKDDDGNDMTINITPRASHRLKAIAEKDSNPNLALRVAVESGGCHGFQYLMSLIDIKDIDAAEDSVFENEEEVGEGYRPKVVMDEPSLELLKGSNVDYTMELIGSQFKVTGIPGAQSSCGCGTSFDIAQ